MVNLKLKHIKIVTIILIALCFPSYSNAVSEITEADIDVITIPENPQPYEDVTIKLSSYSTNLDQAMIEWRSGASEVLSGYGKTSFTFKALGPNTLTVFNILISPADGSGTIVKRLAINPSEITILWEAVDGYTPPFYRGKSFASAEGLIRTVAIPNTSTIKQGKGNITYTWKTEDSTIQNASGFNKNSYTFQNNVLRSKESISVSAISIDSKYSASNKIQIPIINPKIIFYKKSPSEGILYNKALVEEMDVPEDEATIVAEPYFLALFGKENDFTYSWKINGADIDTPSKKTELTIQPTERDGYATINVVFENINTLFQKVSGQLKLNL